MLIPAPPRQPRQPWLWYAPYVAIGVFAVAMLIITALLQWREQDTARSALEGDMHWAERTIESRLHSHADFLAQLGHDQEFLQLDYEAFQVRASRYGQENPDIVAVIWVDTDGKVEWVAPNEATATFVGSALWCWVLSWFGKQVIGGSPELLQSPEMMMAVIKAKLVWFVVAVVIFAALYVGVMVFKKRGASKTAILPSL